MMVLQAALDGLIYSGLYAMLGAAFYVTFGVLRRLDLAFGTVLMASVYMAALVVGGHAPHATLPIALAIAVGGSVAVATVCFGLVRDPRFSMAATLGVWMAVEEIVVQSPGLGRGQPVANPFPEQLVELGVGTLRADHLAVAALAALALVALALVLRRTRIGLAMRAMAFDRDVASLMGASPGAISIAATSLAAVIGCLAGYLFAATQHSMDIHFGMWATLKGLVILVIAQMRGLRAVALASIALGVLERVGAELGGAAFRELAGLAILAAVVGFGPRSLYVRDAVAR